MSNNYTSSQGPLLVRPTSSHIPNHLTICQIKTGNVIAVVPPKLDSPNYGDAAMLAAAPDMLEVLIEIQQELMTSKDTINIEDINMKISHVFEKIHAEADV